MVKEITELIWKVRKRFYFFHFENIKFVGKGNLVKQKYVNVQCQSWDRHFSFILDFRAKGYATIQYIGPRNNLNMTDLSVRINEQSLNVSSEWMREKLKEEKEVWGIHITSFSILTQMKIEGILGGGDLGELINKAAQDSVPVLLIRNEWEISNAIKDFLLPRLNPFLNEFSFEDLENRMP
jgi:hypothetical protein